MKGWQLITAAATVAFGLIAAAYIARPLRYKSTMKKGEGVVILDMRTGLLYPWGTGGEPLITK